MLTHPNAQLTSLGLERLLRRNIDHGESLAIALVDQKPKVNTQIDFHGLLLKHAEKRLPEIVEGKLRRLLR